METIRKYLFDLSYRAGETLMKYYGKLEEIDTKSGEIDLVTVADRKSEEIIIKGIRKAFPDHNILAEESGESSERSSDFFWVIDPLDGTTNFAHSYPIFSTSIAVQKKDKILMGIVYNPYYKELFYGERGRGAFLNNRPIHVSDTVELKRSMLLTGFAYDRRARARLYLERFKAFMDVCHGVRRAGSAALDICSVACGRAEGYWEENLKPWDTAAGCVILEEAGGKVSDFSGAPFSIRKTQFLATNGLIHQEMLGVLKKCDTEKREY